MVSEFKNCPFCKCIFLTQKDLDLHLVRFSGKADLHQRNAICLHCRVEHQDLETVDGVENWVSVIDCPLKKKR